MKTLFCSPIPAEDPRLGASRVIMDLAEAWRACGWDCDVYSAQGENVSFGDYPTHLSNYLRKSAENYDVVDFPYNCLPWIEQRHARILKVTRSVLLKEHCTFSKDPTPPLSLKSRLSSVLSARSQAKRGKILSQAFLNQQTNIRDSNLTTVGNQKDKECLIQLGVSASKIVVLPYGLTDSHKEHLFQCTPSQEQNGHPTIAFIGTFDYRKGCLDWSDIFTHISKYFPLAQLKLIGTRGMCQDAKDVLRFFPKNTHDRISVIPTFKPTMLPNLLDNCSVGVFPSYREGFGIGVVEMLAAGLPVLAYDAPGPCDILPNEWLVSKGDRVCLAKTIVSLLHEPEWLPLIKQARATAQKFLWSQIARQTCDIYEGALHELR